MRTVPPCVVILLRPMAFTLVALMATDPCLATGADSQERVAVLARQFHAQASDVRVKLTSGKTLEGVIVSVADASFMLRQRKTEHDVTLQYTEVADIKKRGPRRIVKIGLVILGVLAVASCVMPYPFSICDTTDPS